MAAVPKAQDPAQPAGRIVADVSDGLAVATLDRPAALNALTPRMIDQLASCFDAWEADPGVRVILLRGAGERGFCAGGDVRFLRESFLAGTALHHDFFQAEYALDCRIHTCRKPVACLMEGIVMGGGMGLSQGAALRIAGPRTRIAMPETAIGLFPDVAGSWFLSRAPGRLGRYLGLVGASIGAADAIEAGLADAFFPPGSQALLETELRRVAAADDVARALRDMARRLAGTPPAGEFPRVREAIDFHFGHGSVAAILASLESEARPALHAWARKTRELLAHRSPTMLRVTFEQLERARSLTLADCFRMELNMVYGCFDQGDIAEGIRALLVDKDNAPKWRPATLPEVADESVAAFFAPRWSAQEHPLRHL